MTNTFSLRFPLQDRVHQGRSLIAVRNLRDTFRRDGSHRADHRYRPRYFAQVSAGIIRIVSRTA